MVRSVYCDRELFVREVVLNQADLASGCQVIAFSSHSMPTPGFWDANPPVANFEVPLQDRIALIQPFQKVCAFTRA